MQAKVAVGKLAIMQNKLSTGSSRCLQSSTAIEVLYSDPMIALDVKNFFLISCKSKHELVSEPEKGELSRAPLGFFLTTDDAENPIPWSLLENQNRENYIIVCADSRLQSTSLHQPKTIVHPYFISSLISSKRC